MPHFVDTNVVVYAFAKGPKAHRAAQVLSGATISVQTLNEFANVGIRKLSYDQTALAQRIASIRKQIGTIVAVDELTHDLARHIVFQYKMSFYDSALLAAAVLADCDTFYSEDLHHGLLIEDQLQVINPFA